MYNLSDIRILQHTIAKMILKVLKISKTTNKQIKTQHVLQLKRHFYRSYMANNQHDYMIKRILKKISH